MTMEYALYALIGIIVTAVVSVISTRISQIWNSSDSKAEILIKEHEERSKDENHRIEREFMSLEKAIKELEKLIQEVRTFVAQQSDKNEFVASQFGLLWDKHNENRKEIDDVKNRVSKLEYRDKHGN